MLDPGPLSNWQWWPRFSQAALGPAIWDKAPQRRRCRRPSGLPSRCDPLDANSRRRDRSWSLGQIIGPAAVCQSHLRPMALLYSYAVRFPARPLPTRHKKLPTLTWPLLRRNS